MRVTLISAGSRGDIAPFAVLASALQEAGHAAVLLAHEEFRTLVGSPGVRFLAARGDNPRAILDSPEGRRLLARARSPKGYAREFRKLVDPVIETAFEDTLSAAEGADLVVYSPMAFGAFNVAEKLGVPALQMQLQTFLPSRDLPTVFSTVRTLGPLGNRISHAMGERVLGNAIREPMNRARRTVLGLPPRTAHNLIAEQRTREVGALLAFDAELVPPARAWAASGAVQCGALTGAPAAGTILPTDISAFLDQGGPCLYFGFGSMLVDHPEALVSAIETAADRLSFRAIVQRGWGELEARPGSTSRLLFIDEVDHGLLFPQVDAIVHHGGAGTTARAARSGRPSLVIPLMGDQFFWGHRAASAGLGPNALPCDDVTPGRLTKRIAELLADERYARRAKEVAAALTTRDPVSAAVRHVEAARRPVSSRRATSARTGASS